MEHQKELEKRITGLVIAALEKLNKRQVPVGISNRHVHLCRSDMDILFGKGSQLTVKKPVRQPGQFAAEETVTLRGPKQELSHVRVLGPLRGETQIELSLADGRTLGVKPPIAISGQLDGTPGIEIIGPCGSVKKERGVIAALRHIHMLPEMAAEMGFTDGEIVDVKIEGERGGLLSGVLMRVAPNSAFEMHIDVEEANAHCIQNGDLLEIIKKDEL